MASTVFTLDGPFSERKRQEADAFVAHCFYRGTFATPAHDARLTIDLEQIATRPCPIAVTRTLSHHRWRRTAADIRSDGADLCAVRYLVSGRARVTQQGRTIELAPGDIVFNRSNLPIQVDVFGGADGSRLEMLIALLPSALLQKHVDVDALVNAPFSSANERHGLLVDLLDLLRRQAGQLDETTGDLLLQALLNTIAGVAAAAGMTEREDGCVSMARLSTIRAQIKTHFSNPNLSLDMIAQKCGISPRYVTYIMKKYRTSFYEELRLERLQAARRILQGPQRHVPIKQVAHFTGFKSASHFSVVYKREFGLSPCEERVLAQSAAPGAPIPDKAPLAN